MGVRFTHREVCCHALLAAPSLQQPAVEVYVPFMVDSCANMHCHWRSLKAGEQNEGDDAFRYHKSTGTRLPCSTCRTAIPFCLNASLNATLWPSGSVSTRTPSQSNSSASGLQSRNKALLQCVPISEVHARTVELPAS